MTKYWKTINPSTDVVSWTAYLTPDSTKYLAIVRSTDVINWVAGSTMAASPGTYSVESMDDLIHDVNWDPLG